MREKKQVGRPLNCHTMQSFGQVFLRNFRIRCMNCAASHTTGRPQRIFEMAPHDRVTDRMAFPCSGYLLPRLSASI